jgi:parallel beta-helix repeat protein
MNQKTMWKAVVAFAVALAFVLPSAATYANVGTNGVRSNSENTIVGEETAGTLMPLTRGTIYVDDNAPPEWYDATHVHTISQGVTNATAGDTVYVYNGTYYDHVSVTKRLTLVGESRNNVIVNGTGTGNVFYINTPVTRVNISTFTIQKAAYGIYITTSSNNSITNCDVKSTTTAGIYITLSSDNKIENCSVHDNGGIGINNVQASLGVYGRNKVKNCEVYSNSGIGVYFRYCKGGTWENVIAHHNSGANGGLDFHYSTNPIILNCQSYSNTMYGFYLYSNDNMFLRDNAIYGNKYDFFIVTKYLGHDIDVSNTVNGKPIYYLIGQGPLELNETHNFGFVALINCNNVTVKNGDCYGVELLGTNDSTFINVTVHNSGYGFSLDDPSRRNTLRDCTAYDSIQDFIIRGIGSNTTLIHCTAYRANQYGFILRGSTKNTVKDCTAYNNKQTATIGAGLWVYIAGSRDNTIVGCTFYNNTNGIQLDNCAYSNFTGCTIYNNTQYGIWVKSAQSNNRFDHNNIVQNTVSNAFCQGAGNVWDNGSAGNYWSDYTGVDADQNGIGDTPYNISGGTGQQDRYPFMQREGWINHPPNTPDNPSPSNGLTSVSINADLSWTGGDPDLYDTVTYDVYFGTTNPPTTKVSANQSGTTYDPGAMDYNTRYYWKIVAWDNHGASTAGPIWDFTTENRAPYVPSDPNPANGTTSVSITADLSWTGGDPDPGDTVTYDVFFGTTNPPTTKVSANQSGTTYDPGTMNYYTHYYWKIVAWDNHGASASSPIWDFTTAVKCGDVNHDDKVNVNDIVYLINYLFVPGSPAPVPQKCVADVNNDDKVNVNDVVYLINYLFVPGSPAPDPNCCNPPWK